MGYRASLIWRNLWEVRSLSQQGVRWRVGNGRSIRIWKDKWIPFQPSFLPLTPRGNWNEEGRVCDLIDGDTKHWNWRLLQEMFEPTKAVGINALYVNKIECPDELVWHYEKQGHYTVKSGYLMLNAERSNYTFQRNNVGKEVWSTKIWSSSIPKKTQIFM